MSLFLADLGKGSLLIAPLIPLSIDFSCFFIALLMAFTLTLPLLEGVII